MPRMQIRIKREIIADECGNHIGDFVNVITMMGTVLYGKLISVDHNELKLKDGRQRMHTFPLNELSEVIAEMTVA